MASATERRTRLGQAGSKAACAVSALPRLLKIMRAPWQSMTMAETELLCPPKPCMREASTPSRWKCCAKTSAAASSPHWATKSHVGTQTGQGHSGIGRHPAHTLVVLVGWGFGGECGEGLNAKHPVQRDMAHSHQSRIHESTLSTR